MGEKNKVTHQQKHFQGESLAKVGTRDNSGGVFLSTRFKNLCKFPKVVTFSCFLLTVRHSEVRVGSNSFGRNRLKMEMNIKIFALRLIWYGLVRPE